MKKHNTLRNSFAAAAVLAAVACAAPAAAGTFVYEYGGVVDSCPVTGIPPCGIVLFEGDLIGGPLSVYGDAVTPGGSFAYTDVLSFAFMVGAVFAVTSDNSALVDGSVDLDGSGSVIGGSLTILATALPDAPPTEVILDFSTNTWLAQALVPGVPDPVFIASGTGSLAPAVVPLPGALFLLAPALLVLGLGRRVSPAGSRTTRAEALT